MSTQRDFPKCLLINLPKSLKINKTNNNPNSYSEPIDISSKQNITHPIMTILFLCLILFRKK